MKLLAVSLVCFLLFVQQPQPSTSNSENVVVDRWAKKLGDELWDLAETITQREEIRSKYKESNAVVEKKNLVSLLTEIVENVSRMMKRKMDAVRCILTAAEDAAEEYIFNATDSNFTYYNSKYSPIIQEESDDKIHIPELPETIRDNGWMYENISLVPNSHFYDIPVNTDFSSVHVPTNVYDLSEEALSAIEWSESLDDVFVQNYNSDPALSWQFFGSSSGVMRHYPAMQWMQEVDLFDCRTRSWFIEAATCSKDVVILLDNSGSMTGNRNHTARFTVSKILDTFSNNDFINVFQYHTFVEPLEKCFDNTLVQATKENIQVFKNRMNELQPENHANLSLALTKAFEILERFRELRGCGEDAMHCNQAIMIVTDGVPNNATEVFEQHNWLNNGTNIPVRVFPYLIGREVANLPEIKWMACLNRGYFAHIRSLDETSEQVLRYIPVIAQPLVLQGVEHPVSWTHAYITDRTFEDKTDGFEEPIRLLTSVTVPAYDRKSNIDNRTAELLGVAGTDVPIEDIKRLVQQHKIGVNGYAFVVSNNGYLIMHPDLRPLYDGKLNPNYNSMDLTELEFVDDDLEPRILNDKIKELREAMVNGSESYVAGLPMKNFYDEMRRPFKDNYDYYFSPLEGTPFSLGIALPLSYGSTLLKINDVIGNNQHMGRETSAFFKIGNWKVHPKWDYCKYRYLEGHEFKTPEEELAHFLEKVSDKDWKWAEQYEEVLDDINIDDDVEACSRKTYETNDYFCNQDLFQRLVFDAMITYEAFRQPWKFRNDREEEVFRLYNATLRFVATMSGLTRWKYIDETNNSTEKNFGDVHCHSIDETWYKSAVLQNGVDPESFVYSVPFESGGTASEHIFVTGSHAIFHSDGGRVVPGSVVGFQFQHSQLVKRFKEITSKTHCQGCIQPCSDDMLDCYILDNNGYIIVSENHNDTGRFFGEIDGAIMESMLDNKTFDKITMYDFQAVCTRVDGANSDSNTLLTPFYYIGYFVNWLVYDTLWSLIKMNLLSIWNDNWLVAAFENYDDESPIPITTTERPTGTPKPTKKLRKGQNREEEEYFQRLEEMEPEPVYISEPCDKKATLFVLNQTRLDDGPSGMVQSNFTRPYFIKRIPHSNLILVIVNTSFPTYDLKITTSKQDIIYNETFQPPCNKLELNNLTRRKLSGCYNEHPMEYKLYEVCDSSAMIKINVLLLLLLFVSVECVL